MTRHNAANPAEEWLNNLRRRDPELAAEASRKDWTSELPRSHGYFSPSGRPGDSGEGGSAETTRVPAPPTDTPDAPAFDWGEEGDEVAVEDRARLRDPLQLDMPSRRRAQEAVVRAQTRPVFLIQDNRFFPETIGPFSEAWARRIEHARAFVDAAIPSVGRVEFENHPRYDWGGTAWLIRDNVLVTNRHVATLFASRNGREIVFKAGLDPQRTLSCNIDFLEEYGSGRSASVPVERVLWIAPPREADIALLLLGQSAAGCEPGLRPIPLATTPATEDEFVVTIGYPARSPDAPDLALVESIFGNIYDKKRLAPGQVLRPKANDLLHDCSTLKGNSGSVVLRLATGEAVGLHYEGEFLQANYAVPIDVVKRSLDKLESPGPSKSLTAMEPEPGQPERLPVLTPQEQSPPSMCAPEHEASSGPVKLVIPLELHVEVRTHSPTLTGLTPVSVTLGPTNAPAPLRTNADQLRRALAVAKSELSGHTDVLNIRLGKRLRGQWITDEDVIIVDLREKLSRKQLLDLDVAPLPSSIEGVGVDVRTASVWQQLKAQGFELPWMREMEAPEGINYREPADFWLRTIHAPMRAVFHVSPDAGFPVLEEFFSTVRQRLTAAIYEWDAEHIYRALLAAVQPEQRRLTIVTQPPRGSTRPPLDNFVRRLKSRLGDRFRHVRAGVYAPLNLFDTAYHIKVGVSDQRWLWLSSGNWKESGQPEISPAAEGETRWGPLLDNNREWHAFIDSPELAEQFEQYIQYDFDESSSDREPEALAGQPLPDVFLPEALLLRTPEAPRGRPTYFPPLVKEGMLRVTPLLTPDHNLFIDALLQLLGGARRRILVQNQSFTYSQRNFEKFERFFGLLLEAQQQGMDVRIIFRDAREFPGDAGERQEELVARLHELGFEPDSLRLQPGCHTKGFIVDSSTVLLGSHNLSNAGTHRNRDASLIVYDPDVARYFERIFEFDWENLADQRLSESMPGIRLAGDHEPTPVGMVRINAAELLDSDFPHAPFFASLRRRMPPVQAEDAKAGL